MSTYLSSKLHYVVCSLDVCLLVPVWNLPSRSCMMTGQLYQACLTVRCLIYWMMPVYLYDFYYLYDFFLPVWCLSTCMMSSNQYDICSTVWYLPRTECLLPTCMTSANLYEVWSTVCSLLNYMITIYHMMSTLLYDVCLPVWFLPTCLVSAYGDDVFQPVWCLPPCVVSCQLYDICSLFEVCLPLYMPACLMSAHL